MFMTSSARAELDLPDEGRTTPRPSGISAPIPAAAGNTAVATPEDVKGDDVLEFLNNDKLHGTLQAASPDAHGLKWKHPEAESPIAFSLSRLSSATLARRTGAKSAAHNSLVRLTNGDIFPGNLVSMDADRLVLDTWYAGKISINRAMIRKVNPNAGVSAIAYEGPVDLESWTQGRRGNQAGWTYKDGMLYAAQPSPIGINIDKMPDMADIHFDAAWRSVPSFLFFFMADNIEQIQGNGYYLQISGSSGYLYRMTREGGSRNLGSFNVQQFNTGTIKRSSFNLLVNKKDRSIAFCIDGKMIQQWTDHGDISALGKGILFQSQNQGDLRISNITVTEWDGKMPQATGGETELKEDLARLVNGDKISGHLKSFAAGKLKLETAYTTLDIPLEQVVAVDTSSENTARARRNKDDIRVHFFGKGEITLGLVKIENAEMKGKSENFGTISMPLSAFRLIEFNIYEERKTEGGDPWL